MDSILIIEISDEIFQMKNACMNDTVGVFIVKTSTYIIRGRWYFLAWPLFDSKLSIWVRLYRNNMAVLNFRYII